MAASAGRGLPAPVNGPPELIDEKTLENRRFASCNEYDPANDSATLFFDGSAAGLTSTINGIDILPSGSFLLTFGLVGSIGGQAVLPNSIYEYDPVNDVATLFFDGNAAGLNSPVNGVASVTVIPEPTSLLLTLLAASAIVLLARGRFLPV